MKFVRILCAVLALVLTMTITVSAVDIFSVRSVLAPPESTRSCLASVKSGGVLELNAEDLERRMGLPVGSMLGATFASAPDLEQGVFYIDGVEVEAHDYFTREELNKLCFTASEDMVSTSVTIIPNASEAITVNLNIIAFDRLKSPPVIEAASFDTLRNSAIRGFINVNDPEEDSVRIQIIKSPLKGEVRFDGQSFLYEPFTNMTGRDFFTICAVDSYGNYSKEEVIEITIDSSKETFTYADMRGNPSLYAAVKLRESGVMTGRLIGGEWFFDPNSQVSRGEFIVMLLAATGVETGPAVNTGLPNDNSIPLWIKSYVKKAAELGIISSSQAFSYNEIPIRAEAVLMTDRAAKISDVKEFPLSMPDKNDIPGWALPSYTDLAAYKMLDLHDGNAHPNDALTNAYAADLVWQLYKHTHR